MTVPLNIGIQMEINWLAEVLGMIKKIQIKVSIRYLKLQALTIPHSDLTCHASSCWGSSSTAFL